MHIRKSLIWTNDIEAIISGTASPLRQRDPENVLTRAGSRKSIFAPRVDKQKIRRISIDYSWQGQRNDYAFTIVIRTLKHQHCDIVIMPDRSDRGPAGLELNRQVIRDENVGKYGECLPKTWSQFKPH